MILDEKAMWNWETSEAMQLSISWDIKEDSNITELILILLIQLGTNSSKIIYNK